MANEARGSEVVEVLRDILIVQLGVVGVPQQRIQRIVGCSINRMNAIVKHLRAPKKAGSRSATSEG